MYQQQNSQGCLSYFNSPFIEGEKHQTLQALGTSQALVIGVDHTLNLKNQHHNSMYSQDYSWFCSGPFTCRSDVSDDEHRDVEHRSTIIVWLPFDVSSFIRNIDAFETRIESKPLITILQWLKIEKNVFLICFHDGNS